MTSIETIRAKTLGEAPHAFLGRRGGVSTGIYAGLNVALGSDDDRAAVEENRRLAAEAVKPGATLVTVHQVHSAIAVAATPSVIADRPHADALVTDRRDLVIAALGADCPPVLFADLHAGVIGAAHAGWKGALGGVIGATVDLMETMGADRARIAAAVGPCIARASYEVGEDFLRRFCEADPENERFFLAGKPGHHQFDIEAFAAARCAAAGLTRIETLGLDTYANEDRFFSYRRATHRGEPGHGAQMALIALPG